MAPLENILEKSLLPTPGKNPSDAHDRSSSCMWGKKHAILKFIERLTQLPFGHMPQLRNSYFGVGCTAYVNEQILQVLWYSGTTNSLENVSPWSLMSPDTSLVQCTITLDEGTQNLFVRGPDILHNVIVSGYVTFYQISEFFVNMLFFQCWQNVFALGELASRAGCGPYDLQVFAPMKTCTNVGRKKLGNLFDIGLLTSFKSVQRF